MSNRQERRRAKRRRGKRTVGHKGSRRVLLQHVAGLGDFGTRDASIPLVAAERLARSKDSVGFTTYPIVRLTDEGIDWGTQPGSDDQIGYGMEPYRGDDCLRAAIATATQVAIEQVPDLGLDRRFARGEDFDEISDSSWGRIEAWADKRGWDLLSSDDVPLPLERWVGVIEGKARGDRTPEAIQRARDAGEGHRLNPFQGHCLVMRHDELVFDPACSVRMPAGAIGRMSFSPEDIDYGFAFFAKEE